MTTPATSLPRDLPEIPQPAASETKLIADGVAMGETPKPPPQALPALATLDVDWPTLSMLSRRYIDRALKHTHGNKTRAADMLGIDRRTLNRIMVRDRVKKSKPAIAG